MNGLAIPDGLIGFIYGKHVRLAYYLSGDILTYDILRHRPGSIIKHFAIYGGTGSIEDSPVFTNYAESAFL